MNARANDLFSRNDFEGAMGCWEEILKWDGINFEAYTNRGVALAKARRFDEARRDFEKAIAIAPLFAEAYNNMGLLKRSSEPTEASLPYFASALRLKPDQADFHVNLGTAFYDLGLTLAAQKAFEQALSIDPSNRLALMNLAMNFLRSGDYGRGWPLYEARTPAEGTAFSVSPPPRRLTALSDLQRGDVLFVHCEQGFGDSIQFVVYAEVLRELTRASVAVSVQPPLLDLVRLNFPELKVYAEPTCPLHMDWHVPLLSLPGLLGLEPTSPRPRTRAFKSAKEDAQYFSERLGGASRTRIGFAWRGNADHGNDRRRSVPLETMQSLLCADQEWIHIQNTLTDGDRNLLAKRGLARTFAEDLTSFSRTAGLIENLDLVISVDTAVAHLAASMGKPTWILLPFAPDWRWGMDGRETHWYPSVRLFRQPFEGDWTTVMDELRSALLGP